MTTLGVTYSDMYGDLEGLINVSGDSPSLVSSIYDTSNAIVQDFDLQDSSDDDEEYNQFISQSKQSLTNHSAKDNSGSTETKTKSQRRSKKKQSKNSSNFNDSYQPISSLSIGIEDPVKDVEKVINAQNSSTGQDTQPKTSNSEEITQEKTTARSKKKKAKPDHFITLKILDEDDHLLFSDRYKGYHFKINSKKHPKYDVSCIKDIEIKKSNQDTIVKLITRDQQFEGVSKKLTRVISYVNKKNEPLGEDKQTIVFRGKKNSSTGDITWEQEKDSFSQFSSLPEINGMAPDEKTYIPELEINVHHHNDGDVIEEKVIYSPIYETIHKSVERQIIYLSSDGSTEIKRYNHCAINKSYVRNLHTKEEFALKANKLNDAEVIKQLPDQSLNVVSIERSGKQILAYCDKDSQYKDTQLSNRSQSSRVSNKELFEKLNEYKRLMPQAADSTHYSQYQNDELKIDNSDTNNKEKYSQLLNQNYLIRYQQAFIKRANVLRNLVLSKNNNLNSDHDFSTYNEIDFNIYSALQSLSLNQQQGYQNHLSKAIQLLNLNQYDLEVINQRQRFSLGVNMIPELAADQDILQLINQSLLALQSDDASQFKELKAILNQDYSNLLCVINMHSRDNIDKSSFKNKSKLIYSVARIYY